MTAAVSGRSTLEPERDLEQYRRELTGYCYRVLGSPFDADDAVQETLVKAWQKIDGFEGRSSVRSWLYRIATNVCPDALRTGGRRATPMDLSSPVPCTTAPGQPLPEQTWLLPIGDVDLLGDPADRAVQQDTVRLAFVAALQHLPPKQRATLLLRDVLGWYTGFGAACAGSRLLPVGLNGQPGYAQYKPSPEGGFEAWCLQVVEVDDGRVVHVHHFLGPELFLRLGRPVRLDA